LSEHHRQRLPPALLDVRVAQGLTQSSGQQKSHVMCRALPATGGDSFRCPGKPCCAAQPPEGPKLYPVFLQCFNAVHDASRGPPPRPASALAAVNTNGAGAGTPFRGAGSRAGPEPCFIQANCNKWLEENIFKRSSSEKLNH
jgi:hypothetical protein